MNFSPQRPEPQAAITNTTVQNQDTLRATQESILALQKMQEQTAKLHQQYLLGQETAQKTIAQLLQQQQALLKKLHQVKTFF